MSTILLVDDDPDILKLISLRLTAAGHSVKGADSGEKALAVLAASRPELVITDLKMGGMDGLTLFDEIRKQAPTLPVIILTAHGTIPEAVAATRRGVFGFQPKPFDGKHLLEQVDQALRLSGVGQRGRGGLAVRLRDAEPENGKRASPGAPGCPVGGERVHPGRERHGKGAPRARYTPSEPPVAGTLRCGQLRGHPGKPARIRIVRPPQRLVYRCELRSQGAHPRRRRRDAVFG